MKTHKIQALHFYRIFRRFLAGKSENLPLLVNIIVNSGLPSIAILEESIKLGSNVILQKNKCNFCHFDKKYCYSCHVFAAHFCRRCRQPVFIVVTFLPLTFAGGAGSRCFWMVYIKKLNICSLFTGCRIFRQKWAAKTWRLITDRIWYMFNKIVQVQAI